MSTASRRWALLPIVALTLTACGGDDGADAGAFDLSTSPEFVNMVIPGRRPLALVTATGEGGDTIQLDATAAVEGAIVELLPTEIAPGDVAEIWVQLPEVAEETPLQVTVTGTRGSDERSVTVDATAMPGSDDLEPIALDIAAVFLAELADERDALPATAADLEGGTPVGGLLVVSHYAWFTDTAEIGLAWHVMVAPDDWAELTIRPRDQLAPTQAYRLSSWSTALTGGDVEIVEIAPPPEVVR
jgi:hypothetical protein